MTKKNFLDDYISGIFNNDNLVSMRDGRPALVFGKYAQHGYIIISPCSSMNDADAIPHIRTMIDSIRQTMYSYMPVLSKMQIFTTKNMCMSRRLLSSIIIMDMIGKLDAKSNGRVQQKL